MSNEKQFEGIWKTHAPADDDGFESYSSVERLNNGQVISKIMDIWHFEKEYSILEDTGKWWTDERYLYEEFEMETTKYLIHSCTENNNKIEFIDEDDDTSHSDNVFEESRDENNALPPTPKNYTEI
jgi:hypothetical protein